MSYTYGTFRLKNIVSRCSLWREFSALSKSMASVIVTAFKGRMDPNVKMTQKFHREFYLTEISHSLWTPFSNAGRAQSNSFNKNRRRSTRLVVHTTCFGMGKIDWEWTECRRHWTASNDNCIFNGQKYFYWLIRFENSLKWKSGKYIIPSVMCSAFWGWMSFQSRMCTYTHSTLLRIARIFGHTNAYKK